MQSRGLYHCFVMSPFGILRTCVFETLMQWIVRTISIFLNFVGFLLLAPDFL